MTSWDAAGDLGTTQTIGDGETFTVSGGSGLGLVLSSSTTSKRVTIVPDSGLLVQEHGGTGLDFTAATDGQLLIGATAGPAALGVVDGGNNITVTYASGDISISANATSITSTSGYYEVWYDATNGLFKYYSPPSV